jgi:hypothetical protein
LLLCDLSAEHVVLTSNSSCRQVTRQLPFQVGALCHSWLTRLSNVGEGPLQTR